MKSLTGRYPFLSLLILLVIGGAVFAQQYVFRSVAGTPYAEVKSPDNERPEVKVSLTGTVERDEARIELEKAGLLNPGEILNWIITSHNEGSAPAHAYKTIGDIPTGTVYLMGSAHAVGDVTITYSIDGGKTYEAKPTISQKQPDGSTRIVTAPASMYTQIRYEWNDPLKEGQHLSAYYQVRVK